MPSNMINSVITSLEMRARPTSPTPTLPAEKIAILRAEKPTVSFYRYLYNTIGEDWLWWERRVMDDETLSTIITDPRIEIFILYVRGVPAGYCELDCRTSGEVELVFFGLMPEFIGRGLGNYFLRWAIDQAWTHDPDRVWVHTCTEDHVNALPIYQKIGFEAVGQETIEIVNPRLLKEFGGEIDISTYPKAAND
ncbi:MAG: GNAT family N-acetyltransferase [Rhodospirillales bacterium]|jgi:GNAT superfamily N-acetyltransferase|nr:GNAT family N-acetyltransferase [Rhodospirillales bacterium]MBT4038710.1 GNAT family N-acetyltransferase [Rhodospirillales bacterium]MBT4627767.1 GNAT family N-acetyltransferase [Rhodospirillales bacterium]MBT5350393.1 GNAT family N-acetyltransferase [Rhodospirillales bacterium]MBT5519704.1 GNAT family N-acetyltransferase [Rhodospirillales bacterium]